jgi:sporulation protein YlmC with PRC-barrel domain
MKHGPGPQLMGADTLSGNDVFNKNGDDLGDIKEIMLDMRSGRVCYAVVIWRLPLAWARNRLPCHGMR